MSGTATYTSDQARAAWNKAEAKISRTRGPLTEDQRTGIRRDCITKNFTDETIEPFSLTSIAGVNPQNARNLDNSFQRNQGYPAPVNPGDPQNDPGGRHGNLANPSVVDYINNHDAGCNCSLTVLIIDMNGPGSLFERYGKKFVYEVQTEVLRAAVARNKRVFDVEMLRPAIAEGAAGAVFQTHVLLRTAIGAPYARHTRFRKNQADMNACVARREGDNVALHTALAAGQPAALVGAAAGRHVIVMGFSARQCVGSTIFGMQRLAGYSQGLLDRGYTVITSRGLLASGGASLPDAYTS